MTCFIDECRLLPIALFDAPIDRIVADMEADVTTPRGHGQYRITRGAVKPEWVYSIEPLAGGAHFRRVLLFTPNVRKAGVVFLSNKCDGSHTWVYQITSRLNSDTIRLRASRNTEYPVNDFTVYRAGEEIRYVRAMKDDPRWEFYESGEPQPFENPEYYKARMIKNRLNWNILVEYMSKLGWDFTKPEFWTSDQPAVYFEQLRFGTD